MIQLVDIKRLTAQLFVCLSRIFFLSISIIYCLRIFLLNCHFLAISNTQAFFKQTHCIYPYTPFVHSLYTIVRWKRLDWMCKCCVCSKSRNICYIYMIETNRAWNVLEICFQTVLFGNPGVAYTLVTSGTRSFYRHTYNFYLFLLCIYSLTSSKQIL